MKHVHWLGAVVCLSLAVGTAACSSDDDNKNSSSGSPSSSGNPSSSGDPAGGGCTGSITSCKLGTLSDSQESDYCDLVLTSISDPPGTVYKCETGPNQGAEFAILTKDQCLKNITQKAECPITVGEVIACFKAVKGDTCGAFEADGACGKINTQELADKCN